MEQNLTFKFQRLIGTSVFPNGTFYEGKKFERPDAEIISRRGILFALLTLVGPADLDAVVFGQAIFDSLEEDYFGKTEGPPLPALEKTAFRSHRRLTDMALASHLGREVDFNLLLAVLWGKVLYLVRLGEGAIYLLRDGKVSEVFLGGEGGIACGSGFVYDGDGVILGSPDFKTHFPVSSLSGASLEKLEERMQALAGKANLSALLLKFQIGEVPTLNDSINFVKPVAGFNRPNFTALFKPLSEVASRLFGVFRHSPARLTRRSFRKLRLGLLVVSVALIFVTSVFLTVRKSQSLKLSQVTEQTFNQVENDLVAANDLAILNPLSAQDELNKVLEGLKRLEGLGVSDPRLPNFKAQAEKLLFQVSKVSKITEPKLVYDFELSQKGISATATNLAGGDDSLFLADRKASTLWRLNLSAGRETADLSGGKVIAPRRLAAFGVRLVVLTDAGIDLVSLKSGEVTTKVVAGVDSQSVSQLSNYNGNLYLLVKGQNQILRVPATEAGYGRSAGWFKEPVDTSRIESLAVNGSVFLKREGGQILKFEGGRQVDFSLSGFRESLSSRSYLYATTGVSDLFLIEPQAARIYRFSEDGAYQKAYDLEGSPVSAIDSLFVGASTGKLYILSGAKVYEIAP